MVSLEKSVSDVKLIWKILRSLSERFRIKVTTIEERKDLDEMKIEELVRSLQTYEYSLPPIKKAKAIALKASKKKARTLGKTLIMKMMQWQCWPRTLGDWWRITNSRRSSPKDWRRPLENLSLKKLRRRTREVPDVLNAQALGIFGLTVGISSRIKEGL
jgi:hypothetical protein